MPWLAYRTSACETGLSLSVGFVVASGQCEGFADRVGDGACLVLGTAAGSVVEGVGSEVAVGVGLGLGAKVELGIGSSMADAWRGRPGMGAGLVVGLGSALAAMGVVTATMIACGVARSVLGV